MGNNNSAEDAANTKIGIFPTVRPDTRRDSERPIGPVGSGGWSNWSLQPTGATGPSS